MSDKLNAFLMGSRVHGFPKEDSDLDMVVRVSREDANMLMEMADNNPDPKELRGTASLYFGKLNIVVCWKDAIFESWQQGTAELIKRKPMPRDESMAYMKKLRAKLGI